MRIDCDFNNYSRTELFIWLSNASPEFRTKIDVLLEEFKQKEIENSETYHAIVKQTKLKQGRNFLF